MLATPQSEDAVFAGERIRALRTLLDVTQVELADAVGVTQTLLSKVESGVRSATPDLIDSVAGATGTPTSFFHVIPPDLPPLTLRFRKLAGARKTETRRVEQLLAEAYRIVWDLLSSRDDYLAPNLPVARADTLSAEDIEHVAARTREAMGIDVDSPVRHVTRLCERSGIVVVPLVLPGEHSEFNAVGHYGVSCWPGNHDPALVGYFLGGSGDRQRFTLAHELGHLVLHTRRRLVADAESEANRFAGALLAPEHRMAEAMDRTDLTLRDFAKMKARWGMSIQALIMRGSHLGYITERRKTSLFKQLNNRGWRKEEPVVVHYEEPNLFDYLLKERFGSGPAAFQRASVELGLPAFTLGQLAPKRASA